MKWSFLLSILVVGCVDSYVGFYDPYSEVQTNGEFQPYVAEFELRLGRPTPDIVIFFVDDLTNDSASAIGDCLAGTFGGRRIIRISHQWWNDHDDGPDRKILIFHEMSHCVLNRPHTYSCFVSDDAPVSIMNPYIGPTRDAWEARQAYYEAELFGEDGPGDEPTYVCSQETND